MSKHCSGVQIFVRPLCQLRFLRTCIYRDFTFLSLNALLCNFLISDETDLSKNYNFDCIVHDVDIDICFHSVSVLLFLELCVLRSHGCRGLYP